MATTAPQTDELEGMPPPVEYVEKIDGHTVDKIELVFTGRISLDVHDERDAALYNRLRMGQKVNLGELGLEGTVAGDPHGTSFDAEGFIKNVTGRRRIRIHSLDHPAGA
jgi:hypothetical protein